MSNTFTSDRYELKQGRFIIVPSSSGDNYKEVAADFTEASPDFFEVARKVKDSSLEYGYDPFIFEGFIVVDGHNFDVCFEQLFHVTTREAAEAKLADMKAEIDEQNAE